MNSAESSSENQESNEVGRKKNSAESVSHLKIGRGWAVLVGLLLLGLFCCAGIGVWLVRGNLPPVAEEQLLAAEQLWEQKGPDSYDLEVVLGGNSPGEFHVEVRQGRVQTPPTRNGIPVRSRAAWETWTVPGQFETIRRELELAIDPEREMNASAGERLVLRGEFDPVYGYPLHYHRIALGGGPEVEWWVKQFVPQVEGGVEQP